MWMEKCTHLLGSLVNITPNTYPTLHKFYRFMCWINNRRPFKFLIQTTSGTFTESGAQCPGNLWKPTHLNVFRLFVFCVSSMTRNVRSHSTPPPRLLCISLPTLSISVLLQMHICFNDERGLDSRLHEPQRGPVISCTGTHEYEILQIIVNQQIRWNQNDQFWKLNAPRSFEI